eukprot:TRINITY_DN30230_c0_g2_i1.p1 TRINITY_DN30230_c0_g2~~TRINITY_DN30230_c0_g2_i1.p1  ORF type:complete len:252 (+),score=6.34 TRINITY_DN30230_c0_g2_i1:50-757(+)
MASHLRSPALLILLSLAVAILSVTAQDATTSDGSAADFSGGATDATSTDGAASPSVILTPAQQDAADSVNELVNALFEKKFSGFACGLKPSGLNFTLMNTLLTSPGLTFFVPTNGAFQRLPNGTTFYKLRNNPKLFLQILTYHIVPYRMPIDEFKILSDGFKMPTLNTRIPLEISATDTFYPRIGKPGDDTNSARIVLPNVIVRPRMIVHGIDTVILPPRMRGKSGGVWVPFSLD